LAIFAAIRRASFLESNFAADHRSMQKEGREPSSNEPQRNDDCQAEEDRQHGA
jgi:hypothetical protein